MAPSWRSLASAASRSIKGYITQQRELKQAYPAARGQQKTASVDSAGKQSWSQWAGQKLRRGSQGEYDTSGDRLALFPGWAARRYREPPSGNDIGDALETPFDVDVYVSGYAYKLTGVGFNTRAGRTFLRLAKSFAALPKLPTATGLSRSTEDLLVGTHLPPLPDEITDESELQALDDRLRRLEFDAQSDDGSSLSHLSDPYPMNSTYSLGSRTPSAASAPPSFPVGNNNQYAHTSGSGRTSPPPIAPYASSDLHRWHANLEARLHPFWSSVLSNRVVRVSLYAVDPTLFDEGRQSNESVSSEGSVSPEKQPIMTREVTTAVDGSFQLKFSVPWERMCVHPGALQIAFGGSDLEHELFVAAELLAPPSPDLAPPPGQYAVHPNANYYQSREPRPLSVTTTASIPIPLSHSSIRVISDIDDTVKLSGILNGARAVFHNVFVKDLRDSVIRGMGDWYTNMWKRGVRFHYVSNGPFELLPVVNEFLQISHLPPGSIRLRSYGGRSLFNGLLSAPAMRKRTGVLDVLNHFPDARFFLVGDSGEQDLELYAEIARDRPDQILGIFIRDASGGPGESSVCPLDDPIGRDAWQFAAFELDTPSSASSMSTMRERLSEASGRRSGRSTPSRSMSDAMPPAVPNKPSRSYSGSEMRPLTSTSSAESGRYDYFSSAAPTHPSITEELQGVPPMALIRDASGRDERPWPPPGFSNPKPPALGSQREEEKKRAELQVRLWRVRLEVPTRVPIRIFREPEDCVEVNEILDRLQVRGR
ncbi:hypothetical protein C8Q74DRAFT_1193864 [Fomes fomentarius]|nr:hypothetical protein C8Q74DRAFT_1193864 [Fomes fomentarius]